ncbi:MAG: multicopper oxidase domain-containing protein [Proteobacteria bacterium]|nr:multicopper oxidase domain-containing protein [Pseudomonadota bacterium]
MVRVFQQRRKGKWSYWTKPIKAGGYVMLWRRSFLKTLFGAAVAGGFSLFSLGRSRPMAMEMEGHGSGLEPTPGGSPHHASSSLPVAWADPNVPISPPPALSGRQMGQVHTLNVPPLGFKREGNVKVFTLIAQPVKRVFTEGRMPEWPFIEASARFTGGMHHAVQPKEVKLWGYNGSMPGPTIEAVEGDRVRVLLKNELPEPTSIHWHGLEVPNDMDGAGGATQPPVPPGGTFVYEFTLHQVGTYMYHTGFNMMKQDGMGLGGLFVIHPKKPKHRIDKDVAIMLQAFALLPGNDRPNLVTMDFNWFTFNGKVAPDIEVLTAREGSRVRIRFGNLTMSSHPIHVHGHTWNVVGTEGGPIPESAQWPGNTINVPPGTTRDVEFIASNPGVWRMHCHKLHHIINAHADIPMGIMPHGGMFTFLYVIPKNVKEV